MIFDSDIVYNIYKGTHISFTVIGIRDMPARLLNQLIAHDRYNPAWFNLKNHTVTKEDIIRIHQSGILHKTPNIGAGTRSLVESCVNSMDIGIKNK